MTMADIVFHKHEMAYGAEILDDALKAMASDTQATMASWIETLKSAKHAVVEFPNGATISLITGTPATDEDRLISGFGTAVFAKGDEREPTYEVAISMPGEERRLHFYQTPEQVEAIFEKASNAPVETAAWTMIADETDESLPEMVKAVYRKGEDRKRHLILLDDHGAGFFGLDLKPRPANPDIQIPDAHVDLQIRLDRILITFWDGDLRQSLAMTKEDPAVWEKVVDDAKTNPAGLVIAELYGNELHGDGKFQRG